MKTIDYLFNLHRARSGLFGDYSHGDVPYVGNGLSDNAVAGFIKPMEGDKVFSFRGICISAFCEATVQAPPYVACGRAGNGVVVLEPKSPMPVTQLAYVAAYINAAVRWRFSWYRQTTADRLRNLTVPDSVPPGISFRVRDAIPGSSPLERRKWQMRLSRFALGDLYHLVPGDYHSLVELMPGTVPVVSCGDANNGISGYFDVEGRYRNRITIAFNGMNTLTAKYHPYEFATKDDVAVCIPRKPLRVTSAFRPGSCHSQAGNLSRLYRRSLRNMMAVNDRSH
jgi:hypothetical protein